MDKIVPDIRLLGGGKGKKNEISGGKAQMPVSRFDILMGLIKEHAAAGRPVIPIQLTVHDKKDNPNEKDKTIAPSLRSWKEYQTRAPTMDEINSWDRPGFGLNGIAMVTGRVSGVFVVDGDCPEALDWMRENAPDTPIKAKTLKGQHWYYQTPAEGYIKSGSNVLNSNPRGVDVRGEGGMIMLPPSVRDYEAGVYYEWLDGSEKPSEEMWASLPVWDGPVGVVESREACLDKGPRKPEDEDGDLVIREHEGRNTALTSRVGLWISRRYRKSAVLEAAREWSARHCDPPLEEKEVATIVASIWSAHYSKHQTKSASAEGITVIFTTPPPPRQSVVSEYDPVPELVLSPGGILREFMDYVDQSSVASIPLFSLGAGLALLGTLVGGKVATQTGLKTNFYVIALAPSGEGKNAALAALHQIFSARGAGKAVRELKGPTNLASDAALFASLLAKPVQLMIFDELGDLMNAINRPRGSFVTGVTKALKELFSCPDTGYEKVYADAARNISIGWHNLSFYGTGVPDNFWDSLTLYDVQDGFLSRNLILQYSTKEGPEIRPDTIVEVPEGLAQKLSRLAKIPYRGKVAPLSAKAPEASRVTKTMDAAEMSEAMQREFAATARSRRDDEDKIYTLYNRAPEYAEKIALIHAVSRAEGIPEVVGAESVEFACALVRHYVSRLVAAAKREVGYHPSDKLRRKVLSLVTQNGYVTVKTVYQNIKSCDSRQAEDALRILANQNLIVKGVYNGNIQYRRIDQEKAAEPGSEVHENGGPEVA
jgi:hypothetical protein